MAEKEKPPEKRVYTNDEFFHAIRYSIELGRKNRDEIARLQRKVEQLERTIGNLTKTSPN